MRVVWLVLVGGCIFGGGKVTADKWPERAAKATCAFSLECAAAAFYTEFADVAECRATNELALNEEAVESLADGCFLDEAMANACLDALNSSCRDAGEQSETLFEPCTMVWACFGDEPSPTTDSGF